MNLKEHISELVKEHGEWTMFADGFDDAILGLDSAKNRVIYSVAKCYSILQERDGMNAEEAEEYFAFNVLGAYMGEKTPIWCYDLWNE